VLKKSKSCQSTLRVAIDAVAKGLDIDNIRMVTNFDFLSNIESYMNYTSRIGKTGKKSLGVSFFISLKYS